MDTPRSVDGAGNANQSKEFTFYEPVFMPIIKFFGDVAYDTLPSWTPWRGFSQTIHHCNNVNLEFQFNSDRLTAKLFEVHEVPVGVGLTTRMIGQPTLFVK